MGADKLVSAEMVKMLEADASAHPPKGAPEGAAKKRKPLKQLPAELLSSACALVADELATMPTIDGAAYEAAWQAADAALGYVPALQRYSRLSAASGEERLAASQQQLQLLRNLMTRDAKRAGKLEKKLEVTLGGYRKRSSALRAQLVGQQQALQEKGIELACFEGLAGRERLARPQRLNALEALVKEQSEREAELQARYAELARTKRTLTEVFYAPS